MFVFFDAKLAKTENRKENKMNKEEEARITEQIRQEMTRVRNDAIVTGMKSALCVVLDMCNKDMTDKEKLDEIKMFCEKGLHNGENR